MDELCPTCGAPVTEGHSHDDAPAEGGDMGGDAMPGAPAEGGDMGGGEETPAM